MKKPVLLLALVFFALSAFAQFTVTGKVIDADTREPLSAASVFAQNTTRGTTTDSEGLFSLSLDKGGYELIISFTGYVSATVSLQKDEGAPLSIELHKADNSLSEVIIVSTNEVADGWEKYGQFFTEHFIGATPFAGNCTLLNPQSLRFFYYKRSDRLKVIASEPLQIMNNALGYNLHYQLDSFVYHFKTDMNSYRGLCFYTEMEGPEEEQDAWKKNRLEAYLGSRLHFLRSYYDSSLAGEGFTVDILSRPGATTFSRLANPYDSSYYYYSDSTEEAELYFPLTASIGYTRKAPEKTYLEQFQMPLDVRYQYSYVILTDVITIRPNGYFFDQKSWINQGYWSWKNLADQLPYDYEPGD